MSAEIIDIIDAPVGQDWHEQVQHHYALFMQASVGTRTVYHIGFGPPRGAIAAAARKADSNDNGLLFQRPSGRTNAGGTLREFEYVLIRCSRPCAQALRGLTIAFPNL